ncbi:MAG: hypothetical protein ACI91T_002162 [Natronomonas sp.]|jgi:hypothetical protein
MTGDRSTSSADTLRLERTVRERIRLSVVEGWARILLVGTVTGSIAGLATFMTTHPGVTPFEASWIATAFVALAGVYTHFLSSHGRASISAAVIGFVVAVVANGLAWQSTILLVDGGVQHLQLAMFGLFQKTIVTTGFVLTVVYFGGYFFAFSLSGLFFPSR